MVKLNILIINYTILIARIESRYGIYCFVYGFKIFNLLCPAVVCVKLGTLNHIYTAVFAFADGVTVPV